MRSILNGLATVLLVAVMLDLLILFTGLAQIAVEGRTGYWNPFWRWQAEQVIRVLK